MGSLHHTLCCCNTSAMVRYLGCDHRKMAGVEQRRNETSLDIIHTWDRLCAGTAYSPRKFRNDQHCMISTTLQHTSILSLLSSALLRSSCHRPSLTSHLLSFSMRILDYSYTFLHAFYVPCSHTSSEFCSICLPASQGVMISLIRHRVEIRFVL